jgi:hypothetical protein
MAESGRKIENLAYNAFMFLLFFSSLVLPTLLLLVYLINIDPVANGTK